MADADVLQLVWTLDVYFSCYSFPPQLLDGDPGDEAPEKPRRSVTGSEDLTCDNDVGGGVVEANGGATDDATVREKNSGPFLRTPHI